VIYELLILPRAQKELDGLEVAARERVTAAIRKLSNAPRPRGSRKLTGRDGWRTRTGDYRILYEINDESRIVTVLHIGHRRDVYR
jgi:mRNA interferase RelE/StbE